MSLARRYAELEPEARAPLRTRLDFNHERFGIHKYSPNKKQKEFHALGRDYRERLLRAGNQNGKTYSVGHEVAMHLTGIYPEWWPGRRWDKPIVAWASSDTAESTRDNPQRALLGPVGDEGVGAIPADHLFLNDSDMYGLASGTAGLYDFIRVRHISGGTSLLRFKHYAQGRRKWQGPPVDVVWCDEEPDVPIYDEGLARTIATGGMLMLSCTPLLGMSEVMRRFLVPPIEKQRVNVQMTIDDAEHLTPEQRAIAIASFPEHEREARARGVPVLGSGLIFPFAREELECAPFKVPTDWKQIVGVDFGYTHPTAFAKLAYDRDSDTVYVVAVYRKARQLVPVHASALKAMNQGWIPIAWPKDGENETAAGPQLIKQYKDEGVKGILPQHAQFSASYAKEKGFSSVVSLEAGVLDMQTRMATGRWKVFTTCNEWFEEQAMYHRKDGEIVDEIDDTICASRYAYMMLRFARLKPVPARGFQGFEPLDPSMGY